MLLCLSLNVAAEMNAGHLQQAVERIALWEPGAPEEPFSLIRRALAESAPGTPERKAIERGMIAVATGGGTAAGVAFACRVLAQIGTEESVGGLLRLLGAGHLRNWALYALERMPYARVEEGLVEALASTDAGGQAAIAGVLGRRGSRVGAAALVKLLDSAEAAVVRAALDALAQMDAPAAVGVIQAKLSGWDTPLREAGEAALLAQAWQQHGQGNDAAALAALALPASYAAGAVFRERSVFARMHFDTEGRSRIFHEALFSGEAAQIRAAVSAYQQEPDRFPLETDRVLARFDALPLAGQIALVDVLWRGQHAGGREKILSLMQSPSDGLRLAAIQAAGRMGGPDAVAALVAAAVAAGAVPERRAELHAARLALSGLSGAEATEALLGLAETADAPILAETLRSLGTRGGTGLVPKLLAWTRHPDASVRSEAYRVLALQATPDLLPEAVGLVVGASGQDERYLAMQVFAEVAAQTEDKARLSAAIVARLDEGQDDAVRGALLRMLAQTGDSEALAALRSALSRSSGSEYTEALRALASCTQPEAAEDLIRAAEQAANDTDRSLAVNGYFRLLRLHPGAMPGGTRRALARGLAASVSTADKRKALSAIAQAGDLDSLSLLGPLLRDAGLGEEARAAAQRLLRRHIRVTASCNAEEADKAVDGSVNTPWMCDARGDEGAWIALAFEVPVRLQRLLLDTSPVPNRAPASCTVYVSEDGTNWGEAIISEQAGAALMRLEIGGLEVRHLKIAVPSREHEVRWSIHEIHFLDAESGALFLETAGGGAS